MTAPDLTAAHQAADPDPRRAIYDLVVAGVAAGLPIPSTIDIPTGSQITDVHLGDDEFAPVDLGDVDRWAAHLGLPSPTPGKLITGDSRSWFVYRAESWEHPAAPGRRLRVHAYVTATGLDDAPTVIRGLDCPYWRIVGPAGVVDYRAGHYHWQPTGGEPDSGLRRVTDEVQRHAAAGDDAAVVELLTARYEAMRATSCSRCKTTPARPGTCCSSHERRLCHLCYRRSHWVEVCVAGCSDCAAEHLPVLLSAVTR